MSRGLTRFPRETVETDGSSRYSVAAVLLNGMNSYENLFLTDFKKNLPPIA